MRDERIVEAITRWQSGRDREASFRRLVEILYRPVVSFFMGRGAPAEEARDLTQETFLRIYRGLEGFRREARFETWVYQIAANVHRRALRDRHALKRAGELDSESMTDQEERLSAPAQHAPRLPLERLLGREQEQRLRQAVERLPARMRTCLALRIYQELSYREIAQVMRLSVETVKAHLYQARKRLREDLATTERKEKARKEQMR